MALELKTYGDLKKVIKAIALKQKGEKLGNIALSTLMGFIPGAEAAKTTFDFIKAAVSKPDTKKTNTWLDKLDVDDQVSAILDDTVENGFMQAITKIIESKPDDTPLEVDFDMNDKIIEFLQVRYKGRTVGGIKEIIQEKCWDGYKQIGMKEKNNKKVPNCVSMEEYDILDEEISDFINELKKCINESKDILEEAKYQGRTVSLNKPMRGDSKKFKVYVKNQKGKVVKVNFGQKGMNIKKNNPVRRKAYRARMHCDSPGPKWKANYWSCKKW